MKRTELAMFCLAIMVALSLSCATTQLPKDATFADKAKAVCADLDAAVLLAQIGLSYAQQSNWAYDYGKAQQTLVEAAQTITTACVAAQTEGDLLSVRNAVLKALAMAAEQQGQVKPWK